MRLIALLMLLPACSLIGTRYPDPPLTRPDCNDSYARPALDTAFASAGLVGVGLGTVVLVNPSGAPNGNANAAANSLAAIGVGVAVAALFGTSAIIGYPRVSACHAARASWATAHPEAPAQLDVLGQEIEHQLAAAARAALACPVGTLEVRDLSFGRNDYRVDAYRWAATEVVGCDRAMWCGRRNERLTCDAPADLDLALQRLALETGCPRASITPLQRLLTIQRGRRGADGTAAHRLTACDQVFVCSVPMEIGDMNDTLLPNVGNGSDLSCHPAAAAAQPPPTP